MVDVAKRKPRGDPSTEGDPPADAGRRAAEPAPDGFAALELDARLLTTIAALGYEEPTPIQREAIPPLLAGRDLLAEAPTGTGKTAAFALPTLQRIPIGAGRRRQHVGARRSSRRASWRCRSPRRSTKYGRELGARVLPVYGGQPIGQQLRGLRRGVDVVVATPGRAVDHLKRGSLRFDAVQRRHPRRGRRDARHGLRRGPRDDPGGDARPTARRRSSRRRSRRPSRASPSATCATRPGSRSTPRSAPATARPASARSPTSCAGTTSWPRCAASSTSRTRPRRSSSRGPAARSTTWPRR